MSTRRPILLVVDDEPSIRHLLHDFGDRAGFEVVTCSGGAAPLEYLRDHTVNIAMVDLQMPEIGSLDSGADDDMVKPITPATFVAEVESYLHRGCVSRPS